MHECTIEGFQVIWDGKTVWINDPSGVSRARYSGFARAIDVHTDFETQMGGTSCLDCGRGDWDTFVRSVREHLGIVVPAQAKPTVRPMWGPADYAGVLERAADRVARGWCQGVYGDRQGGVCLEGAVGIECGRKVDPTDGSYFLDKHRGEGDVEHARMKAALSYLPMSRPGTWNDEPGRTQDEVVQALRDAAKRARAELDVAEDAD